MQAIAAQRGICGPVLVDVADPPSPREGQVLCRTLQLGVCGTDREILSSAEPFTPPGETYLVLGHECLARVEQVGERVENFSAGDLVVPLVRRANRDTRHRVDMLAFGEYTERGIVHAHGFSSPWWLDEAAYLLRVPESIASVAVLAEPLSVAEKAVNEAIGIQQGRFPGAGWDVDPPRVLVTGMGPIGFAAVLAARSRQWSVTLYGRDPVDSFRAALAEQFGTCYVPAGRFPSLPRDIERAGFDLILECTGSDELMLHTARFLASRGIMVWLGEARQAIPRNHNLERLVREAVLRNHVFVGSVNASPRDFEAALSDLEQLSSAHPHMLQSLITDCVSPQDSLWHFQHRRPQGIKTVLTYE